MRPVASRISGGIDVSATCVLARSVAEEELIDGACRLSRVERGLLVGRGTCCQVSVSDPSRAAASRSPPATAYRRGFGCSASSRPYFWIRSRQSLSWAAIKSSWSGSCGRCRPGCAGRGLRGRRRLVWLSPRFRRISPSHQDSAWVLGREGRPPRSAALNRARRWPAAHQRVDPVMGLVVCLFAKCCSHLLCLLLLHLLADSARLCAYPAGTRLAPKQPVHKLQVEHD